MSKIMDAHDDNLRQIDVLKLGVQMIKIIEKFHEQGLIHLDIKVNNLIFERGEKAYKYNVAKDFDELLSKESTELRCRKEAHESN